MLVFRRTLEKGQFFTALDDDAFDDPKGSSRECTLPRSEESSPRERVDSWKHEDRPSLGCESLLSSRTLRCGDHDRSLFRDRTVSWVRIVNGINKYVTETSEEIPVASVGNRGAVKPVAKAGPRPTPTITLSSMSVPYRELKWMDVEPGKFSQGCFEVSKFMIRLL